MDADSMDMIAKMVGTVGFPIGVAWYLLTMFKKSLDTVNDNMGLLIAEIRAYRGGVQSGK